MSDTLKIAYVGCGAIASFHLHGVTNGAPRTKITAAIDIDPAAAEAIAAETGAEVFSSLDDALANGDFDAVDIMTPHHLHEPNAIACLEAGKHVLLEKPMAPTLDACDRILAAAAASDKVFMLGENAQYWPEVCAAGKLMKDGAIGDIITAIVDFRSFPGREWFAGSNPWRFDKSQSGGGTVIDGGSHFIRPLRMWLGEIDKVIGITDRPWKEMQSESLAYAIFRFKSGATASFGCLMMDSIFAPGPAFRITGSTGEIVIDAFGGGGVMLYNREFPEGKLADGEFGDYMNSFIGEMTDFEQAALDGKALEAGPEQSLGELRTALAVYRSAKTQQWEDVWA